MGLEKAEQQALAPVDPAAMLSRVEQWCAINSGTTNIPGLAQQAAALADAFAALPGEVSLLDPAPVIAIDPAGQQIEQAHGQHLLVRVRPGAGRRFLLTGHMDTVYPADHPFQTARWLDAETLNAPGAADMKGGLAVMLEALLALETGPVASGMGYDVLINADEETGSLASSALIAKLAAGKGAALTYEPATAPDGTLAHARGGSGNYSVVATGRSAHAGRNPQDGRNAVLALADLALRLKALTRADLSVNPARIDGGSANNVVPEHAVLRFNIRPQTVAAAQRFDDDFTKALAEVTAQYEVQLHPHGGITRPPKPVGAGAQRLFDLVQRAGADLGQHFGWRPSGGVCDGNNIAAAGVPVVDTMGVRGGAIHSTDEYMIVPSLAERARLSVLVLHRLALGEPA
ncbi:hydrolase [Croceibacterium ferulae]|uniref:hydrolase n=1 Tax=Croceibacterium ferulae TaxID=1854641 RepID=UPI000EB4652F|nr:hydrolase [Croceibacterium ferulae]